jgi:hypothetical protein
MDTDGDFVIVWNSSGQDGSASGVYAQRYTSGADPPPYPGDYNRDAIVDAADYVVWRKMLGATGLTPFSGADGDGDGDVDTHDFAVWKAHFGDPVPPGSGSAATGEASIAGPTLSLPIWETFIARRPQRTPVSVLAMRTDVHLDKLLLSLTASSVDNVNDLNSMPGDANRAPERTTQAAALDDVFNYIGRIAWHGCRVKSPIAVG